MNCSHARQSVENPPTGVGSYSLRLFRWFIRSQQSRGIADHDTFGRDVRDHHATHAEQTALADAEFLADVAGLTEVAAAFDVHFARQAHIGAEDDSVLEHVVMIDHRSREHKHASSQRCL